MTDEPLPWDAEQLRLTLFSTEPLDTGGVDSWFEAATGTPATLTSHRPVVAFDAAGSFQSGENASLVLHVEPSRVDWRVGRRGDYPTEGESWLSVGGYDEAEQIFRELVPALTRVVPTGISRVAFGAVAVSPVVDREHGYRQLQRLIPAVQLDPNGMHDFLYQVNRPRDSTVLLGLRLNRLTKFSVAKVEVWSLPLAGRPPMRMSLATRWAVRVELDMNTAADRQDAIPRDHVPLLADELARLAREIMLEGDHP